MESYIVHVYRREAKTQTLVGVVERRGGETAPFRSMQELWKILCAKPACNRRPRGEPKGE